MLSWVLRSLFEKSLHTIAVFLIKTRIIVDVPKSYPVTYVPVRLLVALYFIF